MEQQIYLIGLNHRTAGVEVRECFALSDPALRWTEIVPLDGPVQECMVLSTCNRVEILAVGDPDKNMDASGLILDAWAGARGRCRDELAPYVYVHEGEKAVDHLFTVASSLDSMIIGEPQILGQLKDAYKKASSAGNTGVILNKLLHRAFSVAKRIRTETGIASSAVSISYAAVELAKRIFGDMSGCRAMLIGAGEMAELAATHLVNAGVESVWVVNRTFERAVELATQYKGAAIPFEDLFHVLADVDIVISSTGSPDPIIQAKDMRGVLKKRKNKPMFFIDIAVPRDINPDVNHLDNIYLYDIDDLKEVVEENLFQRREEAVKAKEIVDNETAAFCTWLDSLGLQPTIVGILQRSESIAQEELSKTLKRLGAVGPETEEALAAMLSAVVKKVNHAPISFLKGKFEENSKDEETVQRYVSLMRRIFDLDDGMTMDGLCGHKRIRKK